MFRSAVFEQLGETKLEGAVTTDICGKKASHALRLDAEAKPDIRDARLHRKIATAILFESNGGQAKGEATQPEIRLAVAGPGVEIGNVETALEALTEACYYLTVERNRYRFSLKENLNKRFADRRASIQPAAVQERLREEIQKVFAAGNGVERIFFPEKSGQVADRPAVTLVVLAPEQSLQKDDEKATRHFVETVTRESGSSGRTFKSALIFCVPDTPDALMDETRKVLAWEDVDDESPDLKLDETQVRQLQESVKKARRDLRECVWRTYKALLLLAKDNTVKQVDLGLVHSSAAPDLPTFIVTRLSEIGDIEKGVSPQFLVRNWPAREEWPTKSVRDAFFATPKFPRLLSVEAVRQAIQNGVANGFFAYVGKTAKGDYQPFFFNRAMMTGDIELSDEVFLIKKEKAEEYKTAKAAGIVSPPPQGTGGTQPSSIGGEGKNQPPVQPRAPVVEQLSFKGMAWSGEIPPLKWMNFYTKVLAKFTAGKGLKLTLAIEVTPDGGLSKQKLEETKSALRELGLPDDILPK